MKSCYNEVQCHDRKNVDISSDKVFIKVILLLHDPPLI